MQKFVVEVDAFRPVVGIDKPNLYLVDEGVFPVFLYFALRLRRLIRANVVVCERVVDDLQSHLDRKFIRRGAVFSEQEFKHENGNVRPDLDLPDEILSHDLSGEQLVRLVVECVAGGRMFHCSCLNSETNRDVGR